MQLEQFTRNLKKAVSASLLCEKGEQLLSWTSTTVVTYEEEATFLISHARGAH